MDADIWNVLHDGQITAVAGSLPGDLRVTVEIAYLCGHLPTDGDHLVITLTECEAFEYRPHAGAAVTEAAAIAALGAEILSVEFVGGRRRIVELADGEYGGRLLAIYESAHAVTAEGRPLSQAELDQAADDYWTAWERKHAP